MGIISKLKRARAGRADRAIDAINVEIEKRMALVKEFPAVTDWEAARDDGVLIGLAMAKAAIEERVA